MKRTTVVAVLLVALAFIGLAAPLAYAQAPAPKVTINGLIDQLTTVSGNTVNYNGGIMNRPDSQWYARTRGRFDITGEIGKAKAVLGLEIDAAWGQTGAGDNNIQTAGAQVCFGCTGSWDLNTDVRTQLELKWLYTEFQMPWVDIPWVTRLGAQPFGAAATYKIAYATGDFAGVNTVATVSPNVKLLGTYVQVEENLVGPDKEPSTGTPAPVAAGVPSTQNRGDDHAVILSAEITPFKGFDIKPLVSWFQATGTTSGSARQGRGGLNTTTLYTTPTGDMRGNIEESRYTIGFDARYRMGPFSFDPTILYQFGQRNIQGPGGVFASQAGVIPGRIYRSDIDAWFFDARVGYQLGPLLLQMLGVYTTGNSARNTTLGTVRYFQPLSTDTGYLAEWGTQLTSLGIDYFSAFNEAGGTIAYPGVSVGWDKYGRAQFGLKATYAITPTLSIMGNVNWHWTAQAVDRNGTPTAGAGITPLFASTQGGPTSGRENSKFVGTEFAALVSWQFAPGLSWDTAGGYMIMGSALDAVTDPSYVDQPNGVGRNTNAPYIFTTRIRFTF